MCYGVCERVQLTLRPVLFVMLQPPIIIIFIEQSMLVAAISRRRLMPALWLTEFSPHFAVRHGHQHTHTYTYEYLKFCYTIVSDNKFN